MTDLIKYTLHLADNALILGHRNSEWTGHGPILEQDIALSNIALDLIGQARLLYQYAATLTGGDATEDTLAYLRGEREFLNCLLVEQPNGHWGNTVLRQFIFSTYQYFLFKELVKSKDETLSAIAEKSLKEVTYHLRWSSEWVIRLGDGTAESHQRMQQAVIELWPFVAELTRAEAYEKILAAAGIAVELETIANSFNQKIKEIFDEAGLLAPTGESWRHSSGKAGVHSEHLGYILTEMQYLQRVYPGCTW